MPEVSLAKRRSVTGYRKKFELCELCGCAPVNTEHVCRENYVKADMREVPLNEEDILEVRGEKKDEVNVPSFDDIAETQENAVPELTATMKTIISYRERKNLCSRCGIEDAHVSHECEENYTSADRRTQEEKDNDPRTIITPKEKIETIKEVSETNNVNRSFIAQHPDPFYRMVKTEDISAQRKFIIIDINKSESGQKFDADYLKFMASKHKGMIVYLIGDIDNLYTFKTSTDLKKISNLCPLKNLMDQNIVNYLHQCERFFGFPSRYLTYSMCYNIPCTTFTLNNFNIPADIVIIPESFDVTRDVVKSNVVSWRV